MDMRYLKESKDKGICIIVNDLIPDYIMIRYCNDIKGYMNMLNICNPMPKAYKLVGVFRTEWKVKEESVTKLLMEWGKFSATPEMNCYYKANIHEVVNLFEIISKIAGKFEKYEEV